LESRQPRNLYGSEIVFFSLSAGKLKPPKDKKEKDKLKVKKKKKNNEDLVRLSLLVWVLE